MSGNAVRKMLVFSLSGPNRPQIPLSLFQDIEPSLLKLFTYAHWVSCVLDQLITLVFLHFHVAAVTLINFILMCLKKKNDTVIFNCNVFDLMMTFNIFS